MAESRNKSITVRALSRSASRARGARRAARPRTTTLAQEKRRAQVTESGTAGYAAIKLGRAALSRVAPGLFSGAKAAPAAAKGAAKGASKTKVKKPKSGKTKATSTTRERQQDALARADRGRRAGTVTAGERQQELLAATGRARARARAAGFTKSTADSARSVSGTKVKGLQKSPGKSPKAIKDATKGKTPTSQWANRTSRNFGIAVTAGGLYAAGGVGTGSKGTAYGTASGTGGLSGRSVRGAERGTKVTPPGTGASTVTSPNQKDRKKPPPPSSGGNGARTGGGSVRAAAPAKPKVKKPAKPSKPMPTVSQSRTMWVKKGDTVGGEVVKKGYLAQYGKAEKRVSAKVNIVADTESGKKSGQTWKYKSGKSVSQVKKKK